MAKNVLGLVRFLKGLFKKPEKLPTKETIYEAPLEEEKAGVGSVWDYLTFIENTQAFHLKSVIGFNEWVPMDEIKRRVQELFNVSYKNERSLYPYIKTMVDLGLLETLNVGGKRKWRKRELLIKVPYAEKKTKKEEGLEVAH